MLTKFYLHFDATKYELNDDDVYNWDQIMCSYKRNDYGGVVRSFSSQFHFVNHTRDILMRLYLRDRYNAKASISVHTITDRWEWEQKFSCNLDFSTVKLEKYIFKINAVDNSLAALIKANKSTKYEFTIGSEMNSDARFRFDRVAMRESLTYGFTQGVSYNNSSDITVTFESGELPFVGNVGQEISLNEIVDWNDDQTTEQDSYLFHVVKDVEMTMNFDLKWKTNTGYAAVMLGIWIRRNGEIVPSGLDISAGNGGRFADIMNKDYHWHGNFSNPGELPNPDTIEAGKRENGYACVGDTVWELLYNGERYSWHNSSKTTSEYFVSSVQSSIPLSLKAGDVVIMNHGSSDGQYSNSASIRFCHSRFVFNWVNIGKKEIIDVLTPQNVATKLLNKIVGREIGVNVSFSPYDSRLRNTFIMAAESLRGIRDAKFYSSFDEFCNFMSAVFGYVYYIKSSKSSFEWIRECGEIMDSLPAYVEQKYKGSIAPQNIIYIPEYGKFLYLDNGSGVFYDEWEGSEMYNDPSTGHPRIDTLFQFNESGDSELYYFEDYKGELLYPTLFDESREGSYIIDRTVCFVHRSELLNSSSHVRKIANCKDVKYNIDTSVIYSTVTIGYDKKDYDNINGRNEFNFNNTYTTGCTVSDKSLSLISRYRADCYGMEFAVQKRGKDTTDTKSDKDVFFVLCTEKNGILIADRSIQISGSLTDTLFNGAFSPMACVRANAGFIGLQSDILTLKFTSSTGNSEIEIGGECMSSDITIDTPLATPGWIEFTTDEVDDIADVNELVEIIDEEGIRYRGFLKDVDVKYAKTEAAKYKLIIKDMEL